ncbi:MAG TPA: hypothetical protein VFS50_08930 [Meiothermus sp.]|nr:hypothetical protein [Meiothermus sp.]
MRRLKYFWLGLLACAVFAQAQQLGDSKPIGKEGPAVAKAICAVKGILVAGQTCKVAADRLGTSLLYGQGQGQREYVLEHFISGSFTQKGAQQALVGMCQAAGDICSGEIVLLERAGSGWRAVRAYTNAPFDFYLGACFKFPGSDGRERLVCRSQGYLDAQGLQYLFNLTAAEFSTKLTATRLLSYGIASTCSDKTQRVVQASTWARKDLNGDRRADLELTLGESPKAKVVCKPTTPAKYETGPTTPVRLTFIFDGKTFKPTAQTAAKIKTLPVLKVSR